MSPGEMLIVHEVAIDFYENYEEQGPQEQTGVRDAGLLLSALNAPQQTYDQKELYQTVYLKAACLVRSIIKNHPFHNANKRTGVLAMIVFLGMNGLEITAKQNQLVHFARGIAIGQRSVESISRQIKNWCVSPDRMDQLSQKSGKRRYISDFFNRLLALLAQKKKDADDQKEQ